MIDMTHDIEVFLYGTCTLSQRQWHHRHDMKRWPHLQLCANTRPRQYIDISLNVNESHQEIENQFTNPPSLAVTNDESKLDLDRTLERKILPRT